MTTTTERFPARTQLTEKLTEKEYRTAFVEAEIRRGLPQQIRAIREARGWNQAKLGEEVGIPQANVSRIENTRDTFLSFATLLRLAEAFDVALVVKFAPFSELEDWATRPLPAMVPSGFAIDMEARKAWEERVRAEAPNGELASLSAYLQRSYSQHSRSGDEKWTLKPRPSAGGVENAATDRGSQGAGVSLPTVGTAEPLQKVGS